ncbi:MAG: FecR domain-containing protein [Deltaproteobacteria bacterium]|nr:FecR domain-containing protein [Deltaproteobacteria bacterium]
MKARTCRISLLFLLILVLLPFSAWAGDGWTVELTVMKNDNLINVCKKYLEDPLQWPEIGRINRLKDYDLIRTGQTLLIPVRLLKGIPVEGRVSFVKGDVSLQSAEGGAWKALRLNEKVMQGSKIRTGEESAVEIVFADGSAVYQRPDTALGLEVAEQKGAMYMLHQLFLSAGKMLMKVRSATGQESRIEIHTPSAVAVARGTDFRVSQDAKGATTSEVLQGLVDVEAMQKVVHLREGEGTRVDEGEPPLPPRKLLPPPEPLELQPLYRTLPLAIRFGNVEGAVSYRYLLAKDVEGRDVIREKVLGPGTPLEITGLDDGTYHLQSRSIDDLAIEGLPLAPPLAVHVRVNPLPPFIQEPLDDSRYRGKSVAFRWLNVPDSVVYQIQFAREKDFSKPLAEPVNVKSLEYEKNFSDYGPYYFRIRSLADDGYEGLWSDAVGFVLETPPPSPPVEKPSLEGKELHIRWQDLGERMSYHCQIARDKDFRDMVVDRKLDKPEITVPRPEKAGIYYVRTSSIDSEGYEGGFSSPQSFEIKRQWPLIPILSVIGALLLALF